MSELTGSSNEFTTEIQILELKNLIPRNVNHLEQDTNALQLNLEHQNTILVKIGKVY